MLPKPFAGIRIVFGEMIHLNGADRKTEVETWRRYLENVMQPYLIRS
jgi:lysophospholipid acyltransferase (LPLAT)-like uncharacterized protein